MFETVKVDFVLEATEPIVHQKETIGNQGVPMTRGMRLADGSREDIPIITGDSLRHGLREAVVIAYLDAAGLLGETLTEAALRLLFNGGNITGSAGGSIKMGDYWRMVEIAPHLGLLGGNAQNRSIPGRVCVSDATLICEETLPWLDAHHAHVAAWVREHAGQVSTYRAALEEETRVRMDATGDPTLRALLLPDQAALVHQRLIANEAASETGDRLAQAGAKSSMMPRTHVAIKAGELFHWSVTAHLLSEMDRETFFVMLGTYLRRAKVGGKKAVGRGGIAPVKGWQVNVLRPSERTDGLDVLGARVGDAFRAHAKAKAGELAAFLSSVAA